MKLTYITESNWFSKVLLHKPDWPEVGKIETNFNLIESEMMTIKMCVDVLFRLIAGFLFKSSLLLPQQNLHNKIYGFE